MEIRAAIIAFSKRKSIATNVMKKKKLTQIFNELQEKIRSHFSEETKAEMDRIKNKLAKIISTKNPGRNGAKQSTMV